MRMLLSAASQRGLKPLFRMFGRWILSCEIIPVQLEIPEVYEEPCPHVHPSSPDYHTSPPGQEDSLKRNLGRHVASPGL